MYSKDPREQITKSIKRPREKITPQSFVSLFSVDSAAIHISPCWLLKLYM